MIKTRTMKHFEEWAKDKSFLIKIASLLLATSCESFLEYIETKKAGERIEGYIDLPPFQEWMSFYRNHRKLYEGLTEAFRQLNDETAKNIDFFQEMSLGFSILKQITPSEWKELVSEHSSEEQKKLLNQSETKLKGLYNFILKDVIDDEEENNKAISDEEKIKNRKLKHQPAFLFFMSVWAPCFLMYGEYPTYLLRRARHGNIDALEKLLRLDKSLIGDQKIAALIHKVSVSKERETIMTITKALQSTPKVKIDRQKIKYLFAGFLSIISIALGQKLTAAEIHRLFDAVTRDKTGELADPDLIVSPETFEKAIQRARTFWHIIPLPDKK